jgi:hypothetical protein
MNTITPSIYQDFEPMPLNVTGWHGDSAIFGQLICEVRPTHIIEVGTWLGQSALTMAKHIQSEELNCQITCVDTWLGALEFWTWGKDTPERDLLLRHGYPQIYYQFLSNVVHAKAQDVILPLPLPSSIAWKAITQPAQLIYIDGSHEYEDVKADCLNFWNLLQDGGIMFGDDYDWPEVNRAVHDVFPSATSKDGTFWQIQK